MNPDMAAKATAAGKLKDAIEPEWWEDDEGHLFLRHVNLQAKMDATVCLRCYAQLEDTHDYETCEGKKDGKWTGIGITAILTTLKEGDDREITKIPADAAEIIEQLRIEAASESEALAELRAKAADEIRARLAYPFDPSRKMSEKKRREAAIEGVGKLASEIESGEFPPKEEGRCQ